MTINKIPIYPHLIRKVPEQFSWIDHRLVRDRHLDYISRDSAALYLFLVTVCDAQGLSYYGDRSIAKRLGMSDSELSEARNVLVRQRLVAWKKPMYQVLPLEPRRQESDIIRPSSSPASMQDILRQIAGGTL
jgi:hypothetical protein